MRKSFFATSCLLALTLALPAMAAREAPSRETQAKQQLKIGIVDMQKIVRESKTATANRSNLLKELDDKKAKIIDMTKDVQKQEEELNRLDASTSTETRRQKTDKLKHDTRELTNLRQDVEEELKRKEMEIAKKMFADIMQIIRSYAKNERYSLILERSTIIAAEESIDITDKILKLYDAAKK